MFKYVGLKSNFTNISLSCEADGASFYSWERKIDSIPSSAVGVNTNILTLVNLQLKDAGEYRCVATNGSGSTESDYATITIQGAKRFIIKLFIMICDQILENPLCTHTPGF